MDLQFQEALNNLDIVIPVYNAKTELIRTIFSFEPDYHCNFIIVIDGKEDINDYTTVLNIFHNMHNIQIFQLEQNSGPGIARNIGLKHANKELIMFIDAGDTICDMLQFRIYLSQFWNNSQYYFATAAHIEEHQNYYNFICSDNNRMHGKLYRTNFLRQNNILFNPNYPRAHEDIGFNMAIRMIIKEQEERDNIEHILNYAENIVCWRNDLNSITRQENHAYYYNKQNMGLAKNCYYAIYLAKQANVKKEIIENIIYEIISPFYVYYYSTVNEKPEFIEQQYLGIIYFYLNVLQYINLDINKLLQYYNKDMQTIYLEENHPFTSKFIDKSFITWLEDVKRHSKHKKYQYLLEPNIFKED